MRTLVTPVLLVALAACSGAGNGAQLGKGRGVTTTTAPKIFPLTGLPATDPSLVARPAIGIKIENSPASRPQAGLDKADVVYEAVVEGGQTRFLAVFHSTDAGSAGPIRSVRPSDPAIVAPFGGIVAYSGGIARFVQAMRATGLVNMDETSAGSAFGRRRDKSAPHNLYTATPSLYQKATTAKGPPPLFAQWLKAGEPFAPAGAVPVAGLTLAAARATTVGYDWDPTAGVWKRTIGGAPHTVEGGGAITPTTVIVQFVAYEASGESDTTGSPVSEAKVIGSGDAVVFAHGMMIRARWSKPSATAVTTWTDQAGAPLRLPPGRTWVELPAIGSQLVTR